MTLVRRLIQYNDAGENGQQFYTRGHRFFLSFGGDIFVFHLQVFRLSISIDAR